MLLSDWLIGFYQPQVMAAVYISFILYVFVGKTLALKSSAGLIILASLIGSISFFLITNAAVWAFGQMYEPDLSGLLQSYYYALPFFRNTLLGDLFYSGVLFAGYALIAKRISDPNPGRLASAL